jgi:uncharacterized protein (UPF0262 family)
MPYAVEFDADAFADMAMTKYEELLRASTPNVLKSCTVTRRTNADGSVTSVANEQLGPIEIDREKSRPLFLAIGRAILETLKMNGEYLIDE